MQIRLTITGGQTNKSEVSLELPATLGRSPAASLTVPHPLVSRQHCKLDEADGVVVLRDLDSLNGTFFDSQKITEVQLRPGECFSIGPLSFRCDYEATGELPPRPEPSQEEDASPWAGIVPGQDEVTAPATEKKPSAADPDDDFFDFLQEDRS